MHETVARARCHIKIVKNCRAQNSPARILLTPATWSLPSSSSKSYPRPWLFFLHCQLEIELSLQCRAHFVDLIVQKCSEPGSFFTIFMWNRATGLCAFCRPHLPKVLQTHQVFTIFYIDSSSGNNPVHILLTTFPDGTAKPRKQRPSFGDHSSHFHRKNTGFRARECFQTWIHTFPIPHTSQLLSSWCGCHDDCKPSWWES